MKTTSIFYSYFVFLLFSQESIVSVHLIVTELESLRHTVAASPGPSSQPESTSLSQDQDMRQSNQEVEEKVAKSQQEVKAVK